jgi:predicted transcriptional regulator
MAEKPAQPPSREGLTSFTFWVKPEIRTEVKRLALDLDRTVGDLMDEAVADVLQKYKKKRRG